MAAAAIGVQVADELPPRGRAVRGDEVPVLLRAEAVRGLPRGSVPARLRSGEGAPGLPHAPGQLRRRLQCGKHPRRVERRCRGGRISQRARGLRDRVGVVVASALVGRIIFIQNVTEAEKKIKAHTHTDTYKYKFEPRARSVDVD